MKLALISIIAFVVFAFGIFLVLELRALILPEFDVAKTTTLPEKLQSLGGWIDRLEQADKFNGAILIAQKGEIVFERYVGIADETGRPITPKTSFNLASVSKQFTAFAILLLAHEGRLSRDDLLTKHIPELKGADGVTVNHLLSHTSGLHDYALDHGLAKRLKEKDTVLTPADLIAWLGEADQGLKFHPGEKDEYSNTNYVLLAEIIARVSGQSFADFIHSHVFEPLGMRHSAVVNKAVNTDALEDRAYGFRKRFLYFGPNVAHDLNRMDGVAGDGNIYATARDLVIWDRALRDGALLPTEVYKQAYVPVRLKSGEVVQESVLGETIQPGLGWNVQDFPIVTSYGHWQAFSNFYWRNMQDDTVLVLLSNSGVFLRTAMIGEKIAGVLETLGDGK
ncbi:beta-lactamase [Nitratireductor aquibiodomus RA22]|uniref:Beta-lactamase n=1 Tax=Nitratireductor aquibiodomus RA22 TaxID=1189611 RepID=I5BSW4_9HYPH|nr:serine hydrolase domain-containing protein [Nitratireductor aquibiodomus]EIM72666.1 beta-lactamase [Nitratireductor aquibiodomus RA22]